MVSFTLSTIALGLAALTSALPAQSTTIRQDRFSLALHAENYPVLSLNAINSSVIGVKSLVFERPSAYPGTPAYLNDGHFLFDLSDTQPYAMNIPSVGDAYGVARDVNAPFGESNGDDGFGLVDGALVARQDAALQAFFACNSTLDGQDILSLKWGVYQADGKAPEDCTAAKLVTNFNVLA